MSSEPIERRVSYIGDRLKGSRCALCGKEYFRGKDYCGSCGRKSFGKMQDIDFFYAKGKLEVSTLVSQPTNKFIKMGSYVYGIVSFHDGKTRVPGRITPPPTTATTSCPCSFRFFSKSTYLPIRDGLGGEATTEPPTRITTLTWKRSPVLMFTVIHNITSLYSTTEFKWLIMFLHNIVI